MSKGQKNIYTGQVLFDRITKIATREKRSKVNTLSYLCDLYDATKPSQRAGIIDEYARKGE